MKNKNNKTVWIGALLLVLLLGSAYILYGKLSGGMIGNLSPANEQEQNQTSQSSSASVQEPPEAPDFRIEDLDGNELTLADFAGKPVVLNFWASWCSFCKKEMPDFEELYQEMGEDVHFIMLNATDGVRETKKAALDFLEGKGYEFPVYFDNGLEASMDYGASSLPMTVFLDSQGRAIAIGRGALSRESILRGIQMAEEASNK